MSPKKLKKIHIQTKQSQKYNLILNMMEIIMNGESFQLTLKIKKK